MNILDENGESYFVTAFDHSTQEQGTATSKDAFTGGDINASLTQEVVELRKEVIGHGTDQLLYLAGKDGGLVSDDLVDIAVFQDPGIEDKVYKKLKAKNFLFIHKSIIVNYNFIRKMAYEEVTLFDGTVLPISQIRRKAIRKMYMEIRRKGI